MAIARLPLAGLLLLTSAPAFAADIDVTSKIDAVAVYPDGATVTRVIEFEAPAGESTLVAQDFPLGLDQASIRLDAGQADGIAIAGVDARRSEAPPPPPDAALQAELESLHDKAEGIEGEIAALKMKKAFIERYAKSGSLGGSGKPGEVAAIDPQSLRSAWNAVGEDLTLVNEAIRADELRQRALQREIDKASARQQGRPSGEPREELRISFTADQPAKGRILVSYLIGGAGWTPLYDARLDTAKGSLEVVRRARIAQSTGEDWSNVALTVSTARATAGAAAPKLDTRVVAFLQLPPPMAIGGAVAPAPEEADVAKPKMAAPQSATTLAAAPAPPRPGREKEAAVDTGGYQSVWALKERTSILSGPVSKSVRLATFEVTPDVVARTAPALQATAYLEAAFTQSDDTPLFPGKTSIYRDGLYAGQTDMPLATSGEKVRIGFGADDRIKVERVVTRKMESDSGIRNPTRTDKRDFKITLRNGRPSPVKISVEEAVPVSEIAEIKVEVSPQMTPPTTKNADDRRGVMVWTYDVAPGEAKEIKFGYKVTWPWDRDIDLD